MCFGVNLQRVASHNPEPMTENKKPIRVRMLEQAIKEFGHFHIPEPMRTKNQKEGYHQFVNLETGEEHGSFEVFYHEPEIDTELVDEEGNQYEEGWYWWPCFVGCLPECDPIGPFKSSQEAYDDAVSY